MSEMAPPRALQERLVRRSTSIVEQYLPFEHGDLDYGRPNGRNKLASEHCPRWNFDVAAEFHVFCIIQCLCHGDISVGLEQHHRVGPSWLHVSNNEFGENIETKLDISDCLDHADWNRPGGCNEKSNDESPPRQMSFPYIDGNERQCHRDHEKYGEPPHRNGFVLPHHLGMNVVILVPGLARTRDDFFSVKQCYMNNDSCDRCKGLQESVQVNAKIRIDIPGRIGEQMSWKEIEASRPHTSPNLA